MFSVLLSFALLFIKVTKADVANVLMSEVFEIIIDPAMFNWTYEGRYL